MSQMKRSSFLSSTEHPYSSGLFPYPQSPLSATPNLPDSDSYYLGRKVSPLVWLIIIVLAIVIVFTGLLHILVRILLRLQLREGEDEEMAGLQGRLQQLFHIHDSGLDQSLIDSLPVFQYKDILGVKNPNDCAVCLSEFEPEDKLRLLPNCSHAFHTECIDTWLLSHSTCPLCRANLNPSDFSPMNSCSSISLESESESSLEMMSERGSDLSRRSSVRRTNSHLGIHENNESGSAHIHLGDKNGKIVAEDSGFSGKAVDSGEKVVAVKLGKFRNVEGGEGSSSNNANARCFSMGSFEYVMNENSLLKVPIRTPGRKQTGKKPALPLIPGQRAAMSECDPESSRFNAMKGGLTKGSASTSDSNGKFIGRTRKESFSISKIWLMGKEKKQGMGEDLSRKAVSFRFPVAAKSDEGNQSGHSTDMQHKTPSFARRTLLWLAGRQKNVVHPSTSASSV